MRRIQTPPDSKIGELAANFDIVIGETLVETEDGKLHGGLGKAERRYLEVQVSYTGSGPVDNSHKTYTSCFGTTRILGRAFPIGLQRASSKSASVQFDDDGQTNPVYVSMIYDPSGKWTRKPTPSGSSLGLYATPARKTSAGKA